MNKKIEGSGADTMDYKAYSDAIVQSSDDSIYIKTPEGIISTWNKGAEHMYGYIEKEILGKHASILLPAPNTDKFPDSYEMISKGKSIDHYETERLTKDGIVIDVSISVLPVKNQSAEIIGIVSIARDITHKKKSEQASQYARNLMEASLDPFVTISPKGKITDVNQATINITGILRAKLIGTDFSDYFTEPEKARLGYQQVLEKGFITDYPLTMSHINNHLTEVLYNASVYKGASGNVLGVFAAARDVTAQKKLEAEVAEQRTKELIKLADSARFQKLTVGRELKMIELKNDIEELKVQLSILRNE